MAKLTGAAVNQGLAGGAIVLLYGMISGGLAFVFAMVFAYGGELKTIIKLNKLLGVIFVICAIILFFMVKAQQAKRAEKAGEPIMPPKTETVK